MKEGQSHPEYENTFWSEGEWWYYLNGRRQRLSSVLKRNRGRMYVNGRYIPKSHPLWKAGRYKSFNDAAFSSLENYKSTRVGYVYVISNPSWSSWVKIGMAVDAEDRLSSYQTGSPMRDYKLEYSVKCEDRRSLEKKVHKAATKRCVDRQGEWFKMPVREAIKLLEKLHG